MISYTQQCFMLLWKNIYTNESIHELKNSDEYGNCVDLKITKITVVVLR